MRVTAMDIRQQQFNVRLFRGFDMQEVDAFLDEVAGDYEELVRENSLLKDQLRGVQEEERLLRETLVTAQKLAEEHRAQARKEAELIVRDAELQAEKLMEAARVEEAKIKNEVLALKRQRRQIAESLRATLEQYGKMIEADLTGAE